MRVSRHAGVVVQHVGMAGQGSRTATRGASSWAVGMGMAWRRQLSEKQRSPTWFSLAQLPPNGFTAHQLPRSSKLCAQGAELIPVIPPAAAGQGARGHMPLQPSLQGVYM